MVKKISFKDICKKYAHIVFVSSALYYPMLLLSEMLRSFFEVLNPLFMRRFMFSGGGVIIFHFIIPLVLSMLFALYLIYVLETSKLSLKEIYRFKVYKVVLVIALIFLLPVRSFYSPKIVVPLFGLIKQSVHSWNLPSIPLVDIIVQFAYLYLTVPLIISIIRTKKTAGIVTGVIGIIILVLFHYLMWVW